MVDITRPWVVDQPLSTRFPVYTRANVGEVSPHVFSPLGGSMIGGPAAEQPWKQALVDFGAFDRDEFRDDAIDIQGLVHGYIYLNLSNLRVFGARMPGASPELMDRTYLGERSDTPAYEPHPDDAKPEYTERILATVERVFTTESRDDFDADAAHAESIRATRPDYATLTDAELVQHERRILAQEYYQILYKHLKMVYESSLVTGLLEEALAPFDDPGLATRLLGGWGNVASAAPTATLWKLSRLINDSGVLASAFDAGIDGVLDRLRTEAAATDTNSGSETDAATFLALWDRFVYDYGSRSAAEWDAMPHTWETHPHIPLGLLERMRHQPADRDPELQSARLRADREQLTEQLRERLAISPTQLGRLDLALRLISIYMPARELSKTNTIRILHEARLALRELAQRFTERGHFTTPEDLTMVREDELDALLADPQAWLTTIAERWDWFHELEKLEPPYIVTAGNVPPITTWAKKTDPAVSVAQSGDVLTGLPACPGTATGTARVINSPDEAIDLEPGEILIAPITDPGWTPLFTSAEAVVVNVGSTLSHAAIVSRELGIPCVLGVTNATKRIRDGAKLTVNGTTGVIAVH
ncbi:PEP-utilizing enzyme [Nocardia nova]|uniref:PEP-utilizing enzyme n=1 Tax=Nocardia nova TaxID=37330 RepID=UPI0037A01F4A